MAQLGRLTRAEMGDGMTAIEQFADPTRIIVVSISSCRQGASFWAVLTAEQQSFSRSAPWACLLFEVVVDGSCRRNKFERVFDVRCRGGAPLNPAVRLAQRGYFCNVEGNKDSPLSRCLSQIRAAPKLLLCRSQVLEKLWLQFVGISGLTERGRSEKEFATE